MNPAERQYEQQATHRISTQRLGSGTIDNSQFNMLTTATSDSVTPTATAKRPRLESDYQRPPFSLPARLHRAAFRDPVTMSAGRPPHSFSSQSMARSQSVNQLSTLDDGEQQQHDMAVEENVCIGMIKTDIVTVRVIDLVKDDHYEPVNVVSEGKRDHVNYSFTVTSRGTTRKFFGWVPFEDTKILGPLVDHKLIWWDAVIPRNKANHARTPLYIILYCQPNHIEWVFRMFEAHRATLFDPPFFNPSCRYHNPYSNKSSASITSNSLSSAGSPAGTSADTLEQTRRDIAQLLDSIPPNDNDTTNHQQQQQQQQQHTSDDNQQENKMIDGLLVPLLPHQHRGVKWMLDRENNESSSGGILADDMGLGKTIQTIALMASTMAQHESEGRRSTLIVTPLALIQQWANEIRTKTEPGKLKVLVYHGSNRSKDPSTFANYDVVVTTYQVVASDMPNTSKRGRRRQLGEEESSEGLSSAAATPTPDDSISPSSSAPNSPSPATSASPSIESFGPLFQLEWHRVVLDEAQQIKNKNTRSAISCSELRSRKRWCLTGTPMQNHVDELYSLLRFLRIPPLDNYQTFKKTVSVPIQAGQGELAFERLKVVLMAVMLRRTKQILHTSNAESSSSSSPSTTDHVSGSPGSSHETLSLQLPSRDKKDVVLDFSKTERILYELLTAKTKSTVEQLFRAGKGERNYLNMLCMLLRLRQACDHPQLVLRSIRADQDALDLVTGGNNTNNNRKEFSEAAVQRALLAKMAIDLGWQSNTATMAGLGLDSSSSPTNLCELCGGPLAKADVSFCPPCRSQIEQCTEGSMPTTSTKISKMLDILDETRKNHPKEKTIIFSQFTSMLDLMEDPLRRSGFKYCRYDGSMSNHLREKSLEALRNDPECTVMLISLKCGSLGLNLTAANHVILMDIWWNPAVEEQAIDRVHRIGQRLPVHVVRLVMDRTIEQKIIQLQQKKAQMVQGALGDGVIKNTKLTMKEIRTLFDL